MGKITYHTENQPFMEDIIKITIKPEHFRDAPAGYYRNEIKDGEGQHLGFTQCVLEIALKEMFGEDNPIYLGVQQATIWDGETNQYYRISKWGQTWSATSRDFSSPVYITEVSKQAKISLEGIPTTEVVLEKIGILKKITADSDN